jgi:hypothetical protein
LAGTVAAVAAVQVFYAQEARGYAMARALTIGAAVALTRIERRGPSAWRLIAIGGCSLAAMLTHYFSFGALGGLGMYASWRLRGQSRSRVLLVLLAAGIVFGGIWGPFQLEQLRYMPESDLWLRDDRAGAALRTVLRATQLPVMFLVGPRGVAATVGGGSLNTASGFIATVAGGTTNTASNNYATVGGGTTSTASGQTATVGGGYQNTASGIEATVAGGTNNTAAGSHSFAAGRRAKANHNNAFVWADSTEADFASTADNQFNIRAAGGTRVFSNSTATTGVLLAAGGGSWSSASDRNLKTNFQNVDTLDVLEKLIAIPLTTWNYKANTDIRHIGVMAQDFFVAFGGLGMDDKHIDTVDADGVAFAAIQGLNRKLEAQNKELKGEMTDLKAKNAELEARLERLEAALRNNK